jgi:hypothetical protein
MLIGKYLVLIYFAIVSPVSLYSQTSSHQRIGVEGKTILEVSPSIGVELSKDPGYSTQALSGEVRAGLSLFLYKSLSLDFDMPISGRFFTARDALPRFVWAPGDASASLGASFRLFDWRISLAVSYAHPFGVYSYYESQEKRIVSGSGYRTMSTFLTGTRYLDPLALGLRLGGMTTLPREERMGASVRPLSLSLAAFATESLNANVALTASISQSFSFPRLINGIPENEGYQYALSGTVGMVLSTSDAAFRVSLSKRLSETMEPVSLSLSYSPIFRTVSRRSHDDC